MAKKQRNPRGADSAARTPLLTDLKSAVCHALSRSRQNLSRLPVRKTIDQISAEINRLELAVSPGSLTAASAASQTHSTPKPSSYEHLTETFA